MSIVVVGRRRQGRAVWTESLEARVLLSFDPSGLEQESLELLNRMRQEPQAELDLLLNANDSNINSALDYFDVDIDVLRQQWATLVPAQPLAWNEDLSESALFHTQQMRDADVQTHQVPAEPGVRDQEPDLRQRTVNAGYTPNAALGENVFAFVKSMLHAHAAYAIDWGPGSSGIQDPPGHRVNIMNDAYREVGISVLNGIPGYKTGPMLQTQDFGGPVNFGDPFLLGIAYIDLNEDGRYNANEGLAGVDIDIVGSGGVFETTTMSAGGYQVRLPEGTYTITARGGGLPQPMEFDHVMINGDRNLKLDFIPDPNVEDPPDVDPPLASLDADAVLNSGRTRYRFQVRYTDDHEVSVASLGDRNVRVYGPDGYRQFARLVSVDDPADGSERTAIYEITPPGDFWDAADNGIYEVFARNGQVADTSGNFVDGDKIGEFLVEADADDAPTAELVANRLRSGGDETFAFKVIYRDDSAIDVSDLGNNDLRILGPDGFKRNAELVRTNSDADGAKRIGYYTLDAPGARWDARDTGRYKIYVRPQTVSDDNSNFVAPIRIGSITVSIADSSAPAAARRATSATSRIAQSPAIDHPSMFEQISVTGERDDKDWDWQSSNWAALWDDPAEFPV